MLGRLTVLPRINNQIPLQEMTMADQSIRGRFAWHELYTPDEAGAHAFYSKALGWKSQSWDQDPSYQMFVGPSGPLGGTVSDPNGTPHWLAYIGTDDVAATVEQAQRLGGKVVKELQTMPNGGSYAVLADPQGAEFGVYASTAAHGKETQPKRGEFSWHELATNDYKAAFGFYADLFGWERMAEHDMGPLGVYFIFGADGVQKGGMFDKPAEMKGPPSWCAYVRVKDVNQTVKKTKGARGTLINGPMEVPGGDWIAQFLDPYGAMFAAHAAASDVKSAAAPPPRQEEQTAAPQPEAAASAKPAAKASAPAKKAAKKPAKKTAAARSAPKAARKGARKAAKKTVARKAGGKKKAAKKAARKSAAKKKRGAAKSAKRPARKAAARGARKAARRKK
jgi:predicted enzyme related to lactoylglutathione lyase